MDRLKEIEKYLQWNDIKSDVPESEGFYQLKDEERGRYLVCVEYRGGLWYTDNPLGYTEKGVVRFLGYSQWRPMIPVDI